MLNTEQQRKLQQYLLHAAQTYNTGEYAAAEKACERMLAIDSENPDALRTLGLISERRADPDTAETYYKQGLKTHSDDSKLLGTLATLYNTTGDFEQAAGYWLQYIQQKTDDADAWEQLTHSYNGLHDYAKAEQAARKALELKPKHIAYHLALSDILSKQHKHEESIIVLRHATDVCDDDTAAWLQLGQRLQETNHMQEAESVFRTAIRLNPSNPYPYINLISHQKPKDYNADIQAIEALLASPNTPAGNRIPLAFALGKAFGDLKDYSKSFAYYAEGNRLRRSQWEYDIADERKHWETVKSIFTPEFLDRHTSHDSKRGEELIFILGMPRSGSTLLAQILAAHPDVVDTGENGQVHDVSVFMLNGGSHNPAKRKLREHLQHILHSDDDALATAAQRYMNMNTQYYGASARYVDKSLDNFWHIGLIRMLFPQAKILHSARNPMDGCLSIFFHNFAGHFPYAYNQKELGEYYKLYLEIMAYWRSILADDVFYDVHYETVVEDHEAEVRRILHFCGLEWNDNCLNFHQSKSVVKTSSLSQVRQPIYKSAMGRWCPYEKHLRMLMRTLGDELVR